MKRTKKSLLFSGLALMMSALLLVGTTFAWFTDSVTNKGNTIESGTLDIELNKNDEAPLFSSTDFMWEPGRSQQKVVTLSNAGSLWLKYTMSFTNVQTTGENLTEVLDVYKVAGDNAKPEDLIPENKLGTMAELMKQGSFETENGVLAPKGSTEGNTSETFTLVIKMQETADNKYQNASVNFAIDVRATQYTKETDGFGNEDYDANAGFTVEVTESDPSVVIDAANQLKDGETLLLKSDVTLPAKQGNEPRKAIRFDNPVSATMDFGGQTVTGYNGNISLVATNGSDITLTNGKLTAENGTFCTIGADGGNITVDGLYLYNSTANGNSVKVWKNSVVTLNNVTSESVKGGAIEVTGGTVNVNGGKFTQTGYYNYNSGIGAVSNNGVLNIYDMEAVSENYCLYTFNSGGTINVYDGCFTATGNNGGKGVAIQVDSSKYSDQPSVVNVYGGDFDGKISVGSSNAFLNIEAGTFKNTGMTLEQFSAYVAEGSTVSEADGTFVVVKG